MGAPPEPKQCHPECLPQYAIAGRHDSPECNGVVISDGDGTFTCFGCWADIHGPYHFADYDLARRRPSGDRHE